MGGMMGESILRMVDLMKEAVSPADHGRALRAEVLRERRRAGAVRFLLILVSLGLPFTAALAADPWSIMGKVVSWRRATR